MEKISDYFYFLNFLRHPLTEWNGWTLFYFVLFLIACRFLLYYGYFMSVSVFAAFVLAFKTLTNPKDNILIALLKTPVVFISAVLVSAFASAIGSFLFTLGIQTPQTTNPENKQ